MICPNCGTEIRDGLTFCPKCSAEFDAAPKTQLVEIPETQIVEAEPIDSTRKLDTDNASYTYDGNVSLGNNYYIPPEPPRKKRFYEKSWFIILLLIFFWPVGVFLMWRFSSWNMVAKIIISAIFALALIGTFIGKDDTDTKAVDTTQVETEATAEAPIASD